MTTKEMQELEKIAKKYMYAVESRGDLEDRGNDEEDFIETSVWGIRQALAAAYELGKKSK